MFALVSRLLPRRRLGLPAAALLLLVPACSGPADDSAPPGHGPAATLRVPRDFGSIQQAVDRARPGDLVLVAPGVYRESVTVATPRVVLRGADRNGTVIDGEFRRANGVTVTGPGSAVENLTVRNHLANGVLFTGVTDASRHTGGAGGAGYERLDTKVYPPLKGFRASYVTAHNNALYGIYAFDAREGIIEDSYASGQADSGIYVGQCRPCLTTVRRNTVEHNAVGIEVTNASEELYVLGNTARHNRVGATVNSNDLEALAPQHRAVFTGNAFTDNNDDRSPEQADGGYGIGIGLGGGTDNTVERNLISGNRRAGVLLTDAAGYPAARNAVRDNRVSGNGTDLVLATAAVAGNCFDANTPDRVSPADLTEAARCGRPAGRWRAPGSVPAVAAPAGLSFRLVPAPPPQRSMPRASSAPARAAVGLPGHPEARGYRLPPDSA
ncbi:right-handed parallel beta-helix repeat-containing protein [Streptomyces melanogenes]|uniref:Right-handed parallel beta-helix repeat-containing protein n=1 Tax=Streptomyces melanogenes TaxID=67326 RepID=A0ABZ1XU82_9ACTN|nr:right-handed parallel beta-helix repeat-containing protein [Streptomyces melanogenes]